MEGGRSQSTYAPGSPQFGNIPLPKVTLVSGLLLRWQPQQNLLLSPRAGSSTLPTLQTYSGTKGSTGLLASECLYYFPCGCPSNDHEIGCLPTTEIYSLNFRRQCEIEASAAWQTRGFRGNSIFAFLSFWGLEASLHQSLPPSLHGLLLLSVHYLLLFLSYKGICEGSYGSPE